MVEKVLREYKINTVIHSVGLKAVGELFSDLFWYWPIIYKGTLSL